MKTIKIKYISILMLLSLFVTSCDVQEYDNLNDPNLDDIESNLNPANLQDLVGGILSGMRSRIGTYFDDVGIVGREHYRFTPDEPRYVNDLLGRDRTTLGGGEFYITAPWAARYSTIKNTNILISGIGQQAVFYTTEEINAAIGFAKTMQAYELLLNLNLTFQSGIRLDVADPDNLGPFTDYTASLQGIRSLLESGAGDLVAGGSSFPFDLTSGFENFNTPSSFLTFNRAISARVAAYQGDYTSVSTFLSESFLDLMGDFNTGVYYVFSRTANDLQNPMFLALDAAGDIRVAHPSFLTDALAGDTRQNKVVARSSAASSAGLSGTHDFAVYSGPEAPIPVIRNEELILLYAEANHITNPTNAVNAINTIRAAAGLGAYTGGMMPADLVNEILLQRRYSLYGEGHRWIDMRRFDRLGELPIDRLGSPPTAEDPDGVGADDVWPEFPLPLTENQ
ncbi:RagB/SusD family nutrient uptake outer membrane protein [Aquimarina algiphila]|uniref:RagB/SusD family nutrient uptake outer membrane protein n=1 Tax=Aquimarina algiphila TaxID=2047982 RepID=UPI0024923C1A|nr:RagB/SusD family nutrient uptake outer membrane protein [Aquimarina algiphila]